MDEPHRIRIALTFDEWARVADVLADVGGRQQDGYILSLAAVFERAIGNTAVSGSLEAAAERAFANPSG
jgi:hypothetical protein